MIIKRELVDLPPVLRKHEFEIYKGIVESCSWDRTVMGFHANKGGHHVEIYISGPNNSPYVRDTFDVFFNKGIITKMGLRGEPPF